MKSFLQYVAQDLTRKFGNNLSRVAVVFPNKRAALFMSEHLANLSERPIWSPAYITISDLFLRHSTRQIADPIKLVCDLHRCFTEQTGIDETLDHFYGWGQLLLSDFDDVDKNMADPDKVFANLRDLHELDDVTYLTEEQKQAISRFFGNFSDDQNTELKQRFLKLWSKMSNIYHAFNATLQAQQLAYEGALYREVASMIDIPFEYEHYAFVGFNMLHKVEQQLFSMLQKQGKALFYWDFDQYYTKPSVDSQVNEAGHYIVQYLNQYPNAFDNQDKDLYNNFEKKRNITYISASTENAQARYISTWLRENKRIEDGRRTAIVICNESLLQTIIHCLPNEVEKVNITTGYPLIQAPVASLVTQLINLQTTGYSTQRNRFRLAQVNAVLLHPYTKYISETAAALHQLLNENKKYYPDQHTLGTDSEMQLLFTPHSNHTELLEWLCKLLQMIARAADEKAADPLFQESVFRMYTLLNRLRALVESGELKVDITTLQRLIGQLISSTTVPFHGEPAEGLQVMGVLETRNLDFDHLLILSCNEGNMPRGINDTSFIPYSIRKAYGLTTIDHKVSIYSYYFHRLLQRAGDITILYNNATADGQTGEMSRFMLQLLVESPHTFNFKSLQAEQKYAPFNPQPIQKSDEVMKRLMDRFSCTGSADEFSASNAFPKLTPTAINRYLRCPMLFYYNYACGLREPDETEDDTIDNRIFGNIFHEASRIIYTNLMNRNRQITKSELAALLKSGVEIEQAVDLAFEKELFKIERSQAATAQEHPLNGLQLINREVIIHYLRQLLEIDQRLAPFRILGLECDVIANISTSNLATTIGGRIDRLDQISEYNERTGKQEERIRVIDYKTGSKRLKPMTDVEAIFNPDNVAEHSDYYLQTFLYGCIVRASSKLNPQQLPVSPALLFIQHAGSEDYDPVLLFGKERIDDVEDSRQQFSQLLKDKINEIFNAEIDFTPTADRQRCASCHYRLICSKSS